jgi:hypothetical protein
MPLSLTDKQLRQVMTAAAMMPAGRPGRFHARCRAVFNGDPPATAK